MAASEDEKHGTSDEFIDPFCDPCFEAKGLNVKVYGYCKECFQFLCNDCHIFHGKFQVAKDHVILRGSHMPQSQAEKPPKYEYCTTHPKLVKDNFCFQHRTLLCSTCASSNHQRCLIESVADACKHIQVYDTDSLYDNVKAIQDQARLVYSSIETNKETTSKRKNAVINEVRELYDRLISKVNKLLQDFQSEVEENYQSDILVMSQYQETIGDSISRLDSSLHEADTIKGKTVDPKQFLQIQHLVMGANAIIDDLRSTIGSMRLPLRSFKPSKTAEDFLSCSVTLGSLTKSDSKPDRDIMVKHVVFPSVHEKPQQPSSTMPAQRSSAQASATDQSVNASEFPSAIPSVPLSKFKATIIDYFNLALENEGRCKITGLAIASSGKRIVVDYKKIKLFSGDMKFLSSVIVPDHSWDIAVVSDTEAAVTANGSLLVILDISGTQLTVKTTVKLSFSVSGITKYNDKLIVTCSCTESSPPSVKQIDKSGKVYWSVSNDQQGQPLFVQPWYVSSHGNGRSSTVIVSDEGNDRLTLLNGDTGEFISRRTVARKNPAGVTTDTAGNVYVCYSRNRVAVLSRDLSEERILLSSGLQYRPQAIAYDQSQHQLVVSYRIPMTNLALVRNISEHIGCFKLS